MSDDKKKRRMHGTDFWKLYNAQEKAEKIQKELQEWYRSKAKELGFYPDQVEFGIGVVVDPLDRNTVKERISFEVLEDARQEIAKLEDAKIHVISVRKTLANKYKTWPDLIVPATGEIKDTDVEVATVPENSESNEEVSEAVDGKCDE